MAKKKEAQKKKQSMTQKIYNNLTKTSRQIEKLGLGVKKKKPKEK